MEAREEGRTEEGRKDHKLATRSTRTWRYSTLAIVGKRLDQLFWSLRHMDFEMCNVLSGEERSAAHDCGLAGPGRVEFLPVDFV